MADQGSPDVVRHRPEADAAVGSSRREAWPTSTPSRLLIWFGVVLIGATFLALAFVLWQLHDLEIEKTKTDLRRLAFSQSEQTTAALKGIDFALLDLVDGFRGGDPDAGQINRSLRAIVAALPQLKNVFVIDADGNSLYSTRSVPAPQFSVADRPFFQKHRAGEAGLLITPTFRARIDGSWSLLLTRRLMDARGRFVGIVGADINPLYLANLYQGIDLGPKAAIALATKDGIMLARYPWVESRIGQRIEGAALQAGSAGQRFGSNRSISLTDHIDRLHSYAFLDDFPLVVWTVLAMSAVDDDWRSHAYIATAWVVGADTVIVVLIALLVAQMRRREQSEARFRDFAEAASDWYWETDAGLRFTYVSRTTRGHTEFPVHDALGRDLRDLVVAQPEDRSWRQVEDAIVARRMFHEFLAQMRTATGRISHLRLSGMPRFDTSGRFIGYRGVARDLTAIMEERSASARANMRFLYAMEHGTNGFSFWDAEDRFVVCNELYRQRAGRAARLLVPGVGFERFYWEGIRLGEIVSPPGRAAEILALRMTRHRAATGEAFVHERCGRQLLSRDLRTPDGGTLIVSADISEAAEGARPAVIRAAT